MARILIDLIDDIELIIINIFQTGVQSITEELLSELDILSKKSHIFSLTYLAKELETLHKYFVERTYHSEYDDDKIMRTIATISQSIMILKNKINYDLTGGY